MRKLMVLLLLLAGCAQQTAVQPTQDIGSAYSAINTVALVPLTSAASEITIVTPRDGISVIDWKVTVANNGSYTSTTLFVDFLDASGKIVTETDVPCVVLPGEKKTITGRLDMANTALEAVVKVSAYLVFTK
jgi:archaellum component FlaF (FlaF/FlaG flagellin family)